MYRGNILVPSIFFCLSCSTTIKTEFQLPSYLKQCSKSAPDFNHCMIRNAETLIPEIINGNDTLQIPNLNPLAIPRINIRQGSKQIGLNMEVTDVRVFGVETIKILDLEYVRTNYDLLLHSLNMDAKKLRSRSTIQRLEIQGTHKTSGNIMVVKVRGAGKFNITADDVDHTYENTFDYEERGNHSYAVTRTQKIKINSIRKVHFNLENMFGDEKIDTAVNDLLNQYWRELSSDLFSEMSDELLEISKVVINIILGVFPVDAVVTP